ENGTATYNLASVVDDVDFGITHVIRGADHRPNEPVQRALFAALGAAAPEFLYVGLVVGDDGKKLSKRAEGATVSSLRNAGYPSEAVRAYLDELGLPRHDVHLDLERIRSLSVDVLSAMSDDELAERVGVPVAAVPLMRGAHDLVEAGALAASVLDPPSVESSQSPETLERFRELRTSAPETVGKDQAREIIRELKAVGGSLKALRIALTGADHGPELWAVVAALPREEALRRTTVR
ncbi:MAG TPA: glutamate--tRNA ligase family protein, partial [Gaiellaceae bacterium]|nr:glutamate--tRNA ligase family protein [Gaiellaceae bacterium]